MHKSLAILALILLAAGCGPGGSSPASLDGRAFLSVDVTAGGMPQPLVPGTRIRLSFADGNLAANAGCNHIGGAYGLDSGRLIVDALAMTEMGCDPARHAQDEWLSSFLGSRPLVRLSGAELVLESDGTLIRMVDEQVARADRPLTGTRWVLGTIIEGDTAMSVPQGVNATLELAADGNFSLHAGCNQGGGRYQLGDAAIRFSDVVLTEMACQGPRDQVEAAVLAVIGAGPVEVAIDGDQLTLSAGARGLIYTAAGDG